MNFDHLLAIFGSVLATVPVFLPMIPAPYGAIAAIILNAANGLYQLYKPSPSAPPAK